MEQPEDQSPRLVSRLPVWAEQFLQIFGIAGLVVAQPLWSVLGDNPTYFVAHGAGAADILLLVVSVTFVPVVVLYAPVLVAQAVSSKAGRIAAALAVGVLITLVLLSGISWFDSAPALVFIAVLALGTAGFATMFVRFRAVRLFALYLSPAPIVLAGLFLLGSPVRALLFESDPEALRGSSDTSVVVMVFDEFPLGAILRDDGTIDVERFPGFGRLAEVATWYPAARGDAAWTNFAVPAILSGLTPQADTPPVAGAYPRSLFTMLGVSHELQVNERITSLCPESLCGDTSSDIDDNTDDSLARDTAIVALHQHLPASLADRWLPSISNSWTNFGNQSHPVAIVDEGVPEFESWEESRGSIAFDRQAFSSFIDSISAEAPPTLWYQHELLPHMPYLLLPDGRTYGGFLPGSLTKDWLYWNDDPNASVNARQRLLLQIGYIDNEIGALLDRLVAENMLDDTMIVATADHGVSFEPGGHFRGGKGLDGDAPSDAALDDVYSVPLFIKYPGQTRGGVDGRPAHNVDVLPSIAAGLGIDLPEDWTFAGSSLIDAAQGSDASGPSERSAAEATSKAAQLSMTREVARLMGRGGRDHDIYAVGPYGDLVGSVPDVNAPTVDGASFTPIDVVKYQGRPSADSTIDVPALYMAEVDGVPTGSWLAVSVNGTIGGLGPVYDDRDGQSIVEVMLDPELLDESEPEFDVYLVDDSGVARLPEG